MSSDIVFLGITGLVAFSCLIVALIIYYSYSSYTIEQEIEEDIVKDSEISQINTSAPASENAWAIDFPMPDPPAVTTTLRPLS